MSKTCVGIDLDWKDSPDSVIEEVNRALERKGLMLRFHDQTDPNTDSFSYELLKEREEPESYEEWFEVDPLNFFHLTSPKVRAHFGLS